MTIHSVLREAADLSYSLRVSRWGPETTYRQEGDALRWTSARGNGSIAYAAIRKVRLSKIRFFGSRASYWRCVLVGADGQTICLQAAHYADYRRIEDRTATYIPFIKQLEAHIATTNPAAAFEQGSHWLAFVDTLLGGLTVVALRGARLVNLRLMASASAFLMRRIGPWLKGHRVARTNLAAAYPEKSASEIERILRGMWDNLGRVAVEYAHLDRLWDYDFARPRPGRIVFDPETARRCVAMLDAKGPILVFGAHLANWELLSWAVGRLSSETSLVYRAPKVASVDRALQAIRSRSGTSFIPADAQAIFAITNALKRGAMIGLLVDEHFPRGVDVMFLGRPCKATPIFARYARRFDCPIHGGRIVRLPGGRFRFDLTDALPAPRDSEGKIDVAATTQMITGIIEGWIRERPEQWLWIQRRWR